MTRKINQSCKAFSSGLGRDFFTGFLLYNVLCILCRQFEARPHSVSATQHSVCLLHPVDQILVEWKFHPTPQRCLWLVFLVNASVCGFHARPSTLLSFTTVQNMWLASEHTIYSKKMGWASCKYTCWLYLVLICMLHFSPLLPVLTFIQTADTLTCLLYLLTSNVHLCWLDHQKISVGMQVFFSQTQLPIFFLPCSTL